LKITRTSASAPRSYPSLASAVRSAVGSVPPSREFFMLPSPSFTTESLSPVPNSRLSIKA